MPVTPPQPTLPPPVPCKRSHEAIEEENTQLRAELKQLEDELAHKDENCDNLKVNLQAVVTRY